MPHSEAGSFVFEYMKYMHGIYNSLVVLLFMYQGWLGLRIRQGRMMNSEPSFRFIKSHRKLGTFLALLGIAGFFAGAMIVYLGEGKVVEHPLHFFTGLAIVTGISVTFVISRRIRAGKKPWRNPHAFLGILILALYLVQVFLGLKMLFTW
jgi:hypothetical protein